MPIRMPKARLSSAIRGHKRALKRRENEIRKPNAKGEDLLYSKRAKRMTVSKGVLENRIKAADTERNAIQYRLNQLYGARGKKQEELLAEITNAPNTPVEERRDAVYRKQLQGIDALIERLEKKRDKVVAVIDEARFVLTKQPEPQK